MSDRPGEAITLSDIGSVYALLTEGQKALDLYKQALQLSRAVEDRSTEASVLRRIAMVKRDRGELAEARANLEDALVIVEHLRTRITGQELRGSYFASVHQFFESYIDVLMRLHRLNRAGGYDALALQAAERARARTLLDSLAEAPLTSARVLRLSFWRVNAHCNGNLMQQRNSRLDCSAVITPMNRQSP